MAAKDVEDHQKDDGEEADVSLDMSQAAVKKMIADARERGYITYDQLNSVLPPDQVSSDQIEDVMSMLSEMGIQRHRGRGGRGGEEERQGSPRSSTVGGTREVALAGGDDREARPHRRPGADVPARDGLGRAAVAARARSPSPSASRPAATR